VLSDTEIIKLDSLPPHVIEAARSQALDPTATDTKFFALPERETGELKPNGRAATGATGAALSSLKQFMREQELTHINRALTQTGGDKEKAAQVLGVSLATLYRRLAAEE
jgi:transcriptional regulator with PAS, ATPase and Fis domain